MAVTQIEFRAGGNTANATFEDWAAPEPHGRWTEGPQSRIRITGLAPGRGYQVALDLGPFLAPPSVTGQDLEITVNGRSCFARHLTEPGEIRFNMPAGLIPATGIADVRFACPSAVSPAQLGLSNDVRRLGFSVWKMTLTDQPGDAAPSVADLPLAPVLPVAARPADEKTVEFRVAGVCPLCGEASEFVARIDRGLPEIWYPNAFRDRLRCVKCDSIPRERALITVVDRLYPDWRKLRMHESSPGDRGASRKFRLECPGYVASQYDPTLGFGNIHPSGAYRSESFDLVITQDVFEHLFDPDRAIREIARTLRPGGAHIMTVPIANGAKPSSRRAARTSTGITHLAPAQYHGNPVSNQGSLVTIDWGYDIVDYLAAHSGLAVSIYYFDDLSRGMRAICMEVVVCRKLAPPPPL
jgi:hypothetical protein